MANVNKIVLQANNLLKKFGHLYYITIFLYYSNIFSFLEYFWSSSNNPWIFSKKIKKTLFDGFKVELARP